MGISCKNASPQAERARERPGRNGGPMKRGRRHGRLPHSRARAVAGGSNVGRCSIYRLPPCRRPRAGNKELAGSARNGAARWAEKRWLCWGLSVERGQCRRWGGEGGKGGEGRGSNRTLFFFIFSRGAPAAGGKENMWAVRAVGMEACGRV